MVEGHSWKSDFADEEAAEVGRGLRVVIVHSYPILLFLSQNLAPMIVRTCVSIDPYFIKASTDSHFALARPLTAADPSLRT